MNLKKLKILIESLLTEANLNTLNRTYGVEFEMCFNRDEVRKYALENRDIFPDEESIDNLLYGSTIAWKAVLKKEGFGTWDVHQDGSVYGDRRIDPTDGYTKADPALEIVTPILSGEEGLRQILSFINNFVSKLGGYVNDSCGGHIHIGAKDLLEGTEKQVANRFILGLLTAKKFTPLLHALVPKDRRESSYAEPVIINHSQAEEELYKSNEENKASNYYIRTLIDMFAGDRYKTINFKSLGSHGTIEFRIFDGSLDYQTIVERIRFGTAFVNLLLEAEVDMTTHIRDYKTKITDYNKKGPRTKDVKKTLLKLIDANLAERRLMIFALNRGNLNDTQLEFIKMNIEKAISEYPHYKKPIDLSNHVITIDMKTKSACNKADYVLDFVNLNDNVLIEGTKIYLNAVRNKYNYTQVIKDIVADFGEEYDFSKYTITPEQFLAKLDVKEAAPYVISLDQYNKEPKSRFATDFNEDNL